MTESKNAGAPWTPKEATRLILEFTRGDTLEKLVESHGRSPAAILTRLVNYNFIVYIRGRYYKIDPKPWAVS